MVEDDDDDDDDDTAIINYFFSLLPRHMQYFLLVLNRQNLVWYNAAHCSRRRLNLVGKRPHNPILVRSIYLKTDKNRRYFIYAFIYLFCISQTTSSLMLVKRYIGLAVLTFRHLTSTIVDVPQR